MEQPENRRKIQRWLDLLDGGQTASPGWGLIIAGCIFLGFMVFAIIVEQERPDSNLPILGYLLLGALAVLRGAAGILQEWHETLATSLRLLCMAGWVAVFAVLSVSFYSSFGLLGALIGLGLLIGVAALSIRKNHKRLQREQVGYS